MNTRGHTRLKLYWLFAANILLSPPLKGSRSTIVEITKFQIVKATQNQPQNNKETKGKLTEDTQNYLKDIKSLKKMQNINNY